MHAGNEKGPDGRSKLRRLAEAVFDAALAGDMDAVREIGNRRDGRPKQEADLNINHGLSERFLNAVRQASLAGSLVPTLELTAERPDETA